MGEKATFETETGASKHGDMGDRPTREGAGTDNDVACRGVIGEGQSEAWQAK